MRDGTEDSAEAQILEGVTPSGQLDTPLRVRVASEAITGLDRVEAFFQGKGYREVNRSHLVRTAIDRLVRDMENELPEIKEIVLRPSH